MNHQLRYPLVFLVMFFLWAISLRAPIVETFIPKSLPTLPTITILLSPSGSTAGNYLPKYTWREAAGVTWYHLRVSSVNSDGSLSTIYDEWHQTSTVCNDTICSVTPDLTLTPGNYKWSIQIWNDVEYGTWSSAMDFSTSSQGTTYYVSPSGDDSNTGTQTSPWRTIQKAARTVMASDLVYIHGGEYSTEGESPTFQNSGTELNPITLRNYPGEQVVIRLKKNPAFFCWWKSTTQGPKVSYVRILGTDVAVRTLSNGVTSRKGIVIQGIEGEQVSGITAHGCDYWEVGGVDFVDVASGIFSAKQNNRQNVDNSADYWYVHDNRVYGFYRESGMQFNTDDNRIENNEIYKVTDRVDTPYGCQLLNVLGDHNMVQGNVLSRKGSTAACSGIMLEWDLADMNMVEQNRILDVTYGITIEGGDNNLFRNNVIATNESYTMHKSGIEIVSYDNRSRWPCNEETGSAQVLLPPDDPSHPDYQYYYNPRNCHSTGNQIYNNTIYGFEEGISLYELVGENTIIRNNVIGNWMQEAICFHNPSQRQCYPLPLLGLLADHNVVQEPFGFMEAGTLDFYLSANSPLIDAGLNLGSLNPNDFDGNPRPQGTDYDIGAHEYLFGHQP